jgi:nucleoside-diphosphate-sugar epimerase
MNVLITSAGSQPGRLIAKRLGDAHTLRLTDDPGRASGSNVISCDLGHDEATDQICEGIDTIVHVCEPEGLSESEIVDYHSRKTYNLLTAASDAGVGHVVFVSSLRLFDGSEPEYEIDERWAPSATTDLESLRHHIGEFVCREFARANRYPVTCLRFGEVVAGDDPPDDAVTERALVKAVAAAVDGRPSGWSVFHVVSAGTHFPTGKVEDGLGIQPHGR